MSKLDNSKPKFIRTTFPRVREIQRPHGPQIVSQFEEWNKELQPYGKSQSPGTIRYCDAAEYNLSSSLDPLVYPHRICRYLTICSNENTREMVGVSVDPYIDPYARGYFPLPIDTGSAEHGLPIAQVPHGFP